MTTFALLHGAWHGGWCWERLHGPLRENGHDSVAIDLPSDDPDAGLQVQAQAVAEQVADAGDDVIVVAHSASGLVAPLVAALRPVSEVVYLTAFVPLEGRSMADQFRESSEPILLFQGGRETDELGRSYWPDPDATARILHPDLSPADAQWAFDQLRPQAQLTAAEPHPAGLPQVPVTAIACAEDRIVNPEWFRGVVRERLGMDPVEVSTGHFPMITHPQLLADTLAGVAV